MYASIAGHKDSVSLLLSAGANIHAANAVSTLCYSYSYIIDINIHGNKDVVSLLLIAGVASSHPRIHTFYLNNDICLASIYMYIMVSNNLCLLIIVHTNYACYLIVPFLNMVYL